MKEGFLFLAGHGLKEEKGFGFEKREKKF